MNPLIPGVLSWLKGKFPSEKPFPAPNNQLRVRLGTKQFEIYFITSADDAMTAAANIGQQALLHPSTTLHGVMIADSRATAEKPQVQSAINSNHSGDTSTYLGYLEFKEVKKWPNTAP